MKIKIYDKPSFEQVNQFKWRFIDGFESTIKIKISDYVDYEFNCLYFCCQKNKNSEIFKRYVVFLDYKLGDGAKGTPEYIKYKYTPICMPCYTEEHWKAIEAKGMEIYKLNEEQKKRLQENIALNKDDLSYAANQYPTRVLFSRNGRIGEKHIATNLNYYTVTYIGEDNYDILGTYSRAVFHCQTGLSHFTMADYERIVTYLGTIEVVRNDGVIMSLPYYEYSDKIYIDHDIETLVSRKGN